MASVDSAPKAIVFPVRILTKICIRVRCRRRLFGSPEDVVVLETHVLCAYLVSLFSGLCSPFSFLHPVALPLPLLSLSVSLSLSLSLSLVCACASLRLRPSSTQSFACVDVARLGPDQLSLCRLCGSGWRGGRCCVSFFPVLSFPPFSIPHISPSFLSLPVSAIVLACHML